MLGNWKSNLAEAQALPNLSDIRIDSYFVPYTAEDFCESRTCVLLNSPIYAYDFYNKLLVRWNILATPPPPMQEVTYYLPLHTKDCQL